MTHCGNPEETSTLTTNSSSVFYNASQEISSQWQTGEEYSAVQILKLLVQVLIALVGAVGNILVVAVINRMGSKKTSVDIYIMNLAIADLGILFLTFPFVLVREKLPTNWPLGEFICQYVYPVPEVFYGSSVWCIALIAIERYRKIVKVVALPSGKAAAIRRSKIKAACLWFTSFTFFSFPLYFVVEYREFKGIRWCGIVWPSWDCQLILPLVYTVLLTALSFVIPLTIIAWTYIPIARKIKQSSRFITTMHNESPTDISPAVRNAPRLTRMERRRLRRNSRAKKLLTPIAAVFAITMLPLNILRLILVFWPGIVNKQYYQSLIYTVVVSVILNSSANAIIYSMVSNDFRRGIREIFCCVKKGTYSAGLSTELKVFGFRSSKSLTA